MPSLALILHPQLLTRVSGDKGSSPMHSPEIRKLADAVGVSALLAIFTV
jgi:hypothetical protein